MQAIAGGLHALLEVSEICAVKASSCFGLPPRKTRERHLIFEEGIFMEPIDTDLEYTTSGSRELNFRSRFNWLYIIPTLGLIWLAYIILAVIFQWPVSSVVDPLMVLMLVVFFAFVTLLFWAMAPKENR
jgi:hypothetical protein